MVCDPGRPSPGCWCIFARDWRISILNGIYLDTERELGIVSSEHQLSPVPVFDGKIQDGGLSG